MSAPFLLKTSIGQLRIQVGAGGVKKVAWVESGADPEAVALQDWRSDSAFAQSLVEQVAAEIHAYAAGQLKAFTVPIDLRGHTAWRQQVWTVMQTIPWGQTMTYGEIASQLGRAGAARAVGQACGANPVPVLIPCHRVTAAGGRLGGFSSGLDRKRMLLVLEGYLQDAP